MILTTNQIRESERQTMATEPIASIDLMERAGTRFVEHLFGTLNLNSFRGIYLFCGPGNNGGDGLVIARLLAQKSIEVFVIDCSFDKKRTEEFQTNLQRFQQLNLSNAHLEPFDETTLQQRDFNDTLCIDALFGIGLSRPVEGRFRDAIRFINFYFNEIISVDVPSGFFCDEHTPCTAPHVKATRTFTFQFMKWEFMLPANRNSVGEVSMLDIGLQLPTELKDTDILNEEAVQVCTADMVKLMMSVTPNEKFSNKGTFGHALLIAGSLKMPGAAILSATAALRGGCGKLTVHSTRNVTTALPTVLPEAILDPDPCEECVSVCYWEEMSGLNAIAIGPGIGQSPKSEALLKSLLAEVRSPIIFDADALNLLAHNKTLLSDLPPRSVLTPHVKEFERLAGRCDSQTERMIRLKQWVIRHQVTVILKGHNSVVAVPDEKLGCRMVIIPTGNAGMATAGSGDVLTGLLLGLMARTQLPEVSAIVAAYLHGLAGDLALENESEESLIASDICHNIGKAFKKVRD